MTLRLANAMCRVAHLHGFEAELMPNGLVRISDEDGELYCSSMKQMKQWMGY